MTDGSQPSECRKLAALDCLEHHVTCELAALPVNGRKPVIIGALDFLCVVCRLIGGPGCCQLECLKVPNGK